MTADNLTALLRARDEELLAIYENVPGIVFYIAVEPDGEFRFLSVSRDFLVSTGLTREQVVGTLVRNVIPLASRDLPWPHHWLGLSYLAKRQYAEAVTELQTFARLSNGDPGALALLGMVEARAGYHKEAKQILQQLRALPPEQYHSILEVAWLLAALGDRDEAFAWLEKIYPDRPRGLKGLHLVAFLDPLRADPRFQDLQRRVGLP